MQLSVAVLQARGVGANLSARGVVSKPHAATAAWPPGALKSRVAATGDARNDPARFHASPAARGSAGEEGRERFTFAGTVLRQTRSLRHLSDPRARAMSDGEGGPGPAPPFELPSTRRERRRRALSSSSSSEFEAAGGGGGSDDDDAPVMTREMMLAGRASGGVGAGASASPLPPLPPRPSQASADGTPRQSRTSDGGAARGFGSPAVEPEARAQAAERKRCAFCTRCALTPLAPGGAEPAGGGAAGRQAERGAPRCRRRQPVRCRCVRAALG